MKTRSVVLATVSHYVVDCKENDTVDIRCGGPEYLGYDFYVDPSIDQKTVIKLIKSALKERHLPLIDISILEEEVPVTSVQSLEQVEHCIKTESF